MNIRLLRLSFTFVLLAVLCVSAAYASDEPVSLEIKNDTIHNAISVLFAKADAKYTISDGVEGTVNDFSATDVPFEIALKGLLRTCKLTYEVQDGVYVIKPKALPQKVSSPAPLPEGNLQEAAPESVITNRRQPVAQQEPDGMRIRVRLRDTGIGNGGNTNRTGTAQGGYYSNTNNTRSSNRTSDVRYGNRSRSYPRVRTVPAYRAARTVIRTSTGTCKPVS